MALLRVLFMRAGDGGQYAHPERVRCSRDRWSRRASARGRRKAATTGRGYSGPALEPHLGRHRLSLVNRTRRSAMRPDPGGRNLPD